VPEAPILFVNNSPLDFGSVMVGESVEASLHITNVGGYSSEHFLSSTAIIFSASVNHADIGDAIDPSLPYSLLHGDSVDIKFRYAPMSIGAIPSGVYATIISNAINAPLTIFVSGSGTAPSTKVISVEPSSWHFPNTKVGSSSAEKLFTIKNQGDTNLTINGVTFNGDFEAGATLPSYPSVITPGNTLVFGVKFSPSFNGNAVQADGAVIDSDAASSPTNIPLSGGGFLIEPSYVISGIETTNILAFVDSLGQVLLKTIDANNLNSEEPCTLVRFTDLGLPLMNKEIMRIGVRYEDLGFAELVAQVKVQIRDEIIVREKTIKIGTSSGGGRPREALADLELSGEILEVRVIRPANCGAVSIINFFLSVEPRGEFVSENI
jgi:hypothetical protein